MVRNFTLAGTAIAALTFTSGAAFADSISPETFEAELRLGKSVTIEKTVVVESTGTTTALIDSFFLIDTTGSMSSAINNAKAAAGDLLAGLEGFGDNASGVGVFGERALLTDAIRTDITPSEATAQAGVNAVTLGDPDGGGDFPESSNTAIDLVANNASWRPGSNRFIFVLGDASAKGTPDATVIASLAANDVTLVGINFGSSSFADDITDLGGEVFSGGTSAADIVAAVTAGITDSFAEYTAVTVNDLGGGLPGVSVSTVCTSADIGVCVGADAVGDYDRSVDRTFTFDVTFTNTGLLPGESVTFPTFALVEGGIVAREIDTISAPIPLPAAAWLLMGGLGGLAALRRRKS